mmetsp:Transcript_79396/g.140140  ORF Transcript_79396/g.140140 Transcript_79396/m.140140 type:complete len:207 (+) Transcript_79396:20-640(+)|eukprot:CAMPEP_0197621814 /NCGR_PEP_ID=MMETSP1338-20131121/2266_1 /TAXON_ID=43686 ORGANISM="Pelagodinium beii, Strain RCC1491" /NCGR_SAMPLE_ID=MMETSP1338 /ASSEMBLY_ACC=CAM_ASM_000754 /LENGTH=206 /DNA_ID=CAMNT_0043191359 /DNA_START=89 /DNA_END=709 /DNA_ORIENTATION=-
MKPDWDKLMEEFPSVYDVDCTASGKDLCEEVGVSGYPTIKYGDSSDKSKLEDYSGGRDFESLQKFAEEKLAPVCGPQSKDACDAEELALLEKFLSKPVAELKAEVKAFEKKFVDAEKKLKKRKANLDDQNAELIDDEGDHGKTKPPKGKEKQYAEKTAKFEKRRKKITDEQKKVEDQLTVLKDDMKKSGVKLMKAVIKSAPKSTEL